AFTLVKGNGRKHLAEIRPDGTLTSWHPAATQVSDTCPPRCSTLLSRLAFSNDGSALYFGGHFGLVEGIGRNNAAEVQLGSGSVLPWCAAVLGDWGCEKN